MAANATIAIDPDLDIRHPRFNQVLKLPEDPNQGRHKPFTLKYADYGYRNEKNPEQENVLLLFGPLLGSRLIHTAKHELAKQHKVRLINPDRFGIGGTDETRAEMRLEVWRGVVLSLLKHLKIKHVSVACQSGGTIYALDFILHHPTILHPERPYLAIGSPWILPIRSGVTSMAMAQALPRRLILQVDKLCSFVRSTGRYVVRRAVRIATCHSSHRAILTRHECVCNEHSLLECTTLPKCFDTIYEEGITGISQEALLLLQRMTRQPGWGHWGDFDGLAPRLSEALRSNQRTLTLDVYFAEKDSMIGDGGSKGPVWFENCWIKEHSSGVISYGSKIVPGTSQGNIWMIKTGVIQQVFDKIRAEKSEVHKATSARPDPGTSSTDRQS